MTCSGGGTCVVAPTDCPGTFQFCDGFESGSIQTSLWPARTTNDANQTLQIDSVMPHRGSYSLHVHVNALGNVGYVASYLGQTATNGTTPVYIRAWYSLSGLPGPDNDNLLVILSNANLQSASGGMGFSSNGSLVAGIQNTVNPTLYDYSHTSSSHILLGTWTCIEVYVDTSYAGSYPDGQLQVWHDSTTADSVMGGTAKLQPLAGLQFGLDFTGPSSGTSNPVDLFIDDIATSTSYIDCSQ
jgi:hypothetical protein